MTILTYCKFSSKTKLTLVNCFSLVTSSNKCEGFTHIRVGISWISISPTLGWKKVSNKYCLKISGNITIWTNNIDTILIGLSYKTGGTYTSSTCTNTYSTKFKLVDEIKLISYYDSNGVRSNMVLIKNNFGLVTNIKFYSLSNIPKMEIIIN
jgi:hypothetical protein